MKSYQIKFPHGIMFHHFHGKNNPVVQGSIGEETLSEIIEFIGTENILNAYEKFKNFRAARESWNFKNLTLLLFFNGTLFPILG